MFFVSWKFLLHLWSIFMYIMNIRFISAHDNCASIYIDVRGSFVCHSFIIRIEYYAYDWFVYYNVPRACRHFVDWFNVHHVISIFLLFCIGYTITCSLINTYVNRMGPYALVERSDDCTFTSIRLQLRHMAHWNDNSVAVSHLHHIFGFGRKFKLGLCGCTETKRNRS